MKKALSLLLVLAMVLSMVPAVFAEEAAVISEGTIINEALAANESKTYTYVAPSEDTGVTLTLMSGDASFTFNDVSCSLSDADITAGENEGEIDAFPYVSLDLAANEAITIVVTANSDTTVVIDCAFELVVGFDELLPDGYVEERPLYVTWVWNDAHTEATATVTVPAGAKLYYRDYNVGGMYMTINDGEAVLCETAPRQGYDWSIKNEGTEAADYALKIWYPVGHQMNPKVIESFWYSDEVTQEEGDTDGFFYTYTAAETGTVTLYFNAEYDENDAVIDYGTQRDIMVSNQTTYAQYSLLNDGVDNNGLELTVPVEAGQTLIINTFWAQDAEGNYAPAGTYSWTGNFAYPVGSEQNPIVIEWTWNDDYTTATASVEVAADGTYYSGIAGMILTANGEAVAMNETGVFQLNAGSYELVLATPIGASENPEIIENIDGYSDSNSLAEGESYYYIWTATEDGTVTLDVTDGANLTVDKLTYTEDSEWPISTQYTLAEPVVDENWNYTGWTVAENLVIEVVAGEQLKIQVNGLTDWSTWTTPAIDYTLTGDFLSAAAKAVIDEIAALPAAADVTLDDEAAIVAARASYDALSDADKAKVTNLDYLVAAEEALAAIPTGPIADANLKFVNKGLSFQEYIGMQFMLKKSVVDKYDRVYIEAVQAAPEGDVTETIDGIVYATSYFIFDKQILSWSMTDSVTVTLYAEKDGQLYIGEVYTSSVEAMALTMLGNYSKNAAYDKYCKVLADMLNYGAEVQTAFGHNASSLPNANLGDYSKYATAETPSFSATNSISDDYTVNVLNYAMSMQSKVELQYMFKAADVAGTEIRCTVDGETTVISADDFDVYSSYRIARVAFKASNFRKVHTIALYDSESGEVLSKVYTISIEGFSESMLSGKYNAVYVAMMKYGDAVSAI